MKTCKVLGCNRGTSGWSAQCNAHRTRARRHGHPEQQGVTKTQLTPYLEAVRERIAKNASNPAWDKMDQRWRLLVEAARAELDTYRAGEIYVRYQRQAYEEIEKVAANVPPRAVVETALALYLMADLDPRRFKSDAAFRFQLARRIRGLTETNRGTYINPRTRRAKRVYRDTTPRATDYLSGLLIEVFGVAGLYVARLEQRRSAVKKRDAEQLWCDLEKLE